VYIYGVEPLGGGGGGRGRAANRWYDGANGFLPSLYYYRVYRILYTLLDFSYNAKNTH